MVYESMCQSIIEVSGLPATRTLFKKKPARTDPIHFYGVVGLSGSKQLIRRWVSKKLDPPNFNRLINVYRLRFMFGVKQAKISREVVVL